MQDQLPARCPVLPAPSAGGCVLYSVVGLPIHPMGCFFRLAGFDLLCGGLDEKITPQSKRHAILNAKGSETMEV